ncbi:MAG TPA: hypothetical protein PLL20_21745 [Phycisphaerae bacterium]|nr:hypothetical protein [Phycisphaerae bacterium]HRR86409.1 hypothetical protein [Phycisphaerae bacterium]
MLLTETMHRQYHGGLLRRLSQKGIYPKRGQSWLKYFEENAGKQQAALDVMVDYTREFDSANGTGLLKHVLQQLSAQGR